MAVPAEIVNVALGRVGHTQFIGSLDDANVTAATARVAYYNALDRLLALRPWSFAKKRKALATLATTRTDWTYVYALPADCLAVRYVVAPGIRNPSRTQRVPHAIEAGDDVGGVPETRVLLTDQEEAELAYTVRPASSSLTPLFADALAWVLAIEFALSLKKDGRLAQQLKAPAAIALSIANAADANEEQPDVPPVTPSIAARSS